MDAAEQQVYIGVTLAGRYLIETHIGSGNFSGVFRALDQSTGRQVAVKILSFRSAHSPEARIELDGEKALLELLSGSSHVVNLLDGGAHQLELAAPGGATVQFDVPYLVLELADGCLAELLLNRARLPWQARLELFRDLVKGVHQMHLSRVVHRDVKSDNSLVFSRPQVAKIADLGRSKNTAEPARFVAEAYEAGRGDLRFAPPELLWKCGTDDPDDMARVDLFLLGSLFFEIATGVAITQLALMDPLAILTAASRLPRSVREADLRVRTNELRGEFLPAYDLFEREVPPHIRDPAVRLLRQLTDPDPTARVPSFRRRSLPPWDLQWLIRKADVLLKLDTYNTGGRKKIAKPIRRTQPAKKRTRT